MTSIDQLQEDHQVLSVLARQLLKIVMSEKPDSAAVAVLRWQMCRKLVDHCIDEERTVFEQLIASGEPEAVALTLDFHDDLGSVDREFRAYIAEWPVDRINREWMAFRGVTDVLLDRLARRITREETEVFPQLLRVLQRRAA